MIGALIALAASMASPAPATPAPDAAAAIGPQLAAVRAFARGPGERLWAGYGKAPFGFLLVAADRELLICHPSAPAGFAPAGRDAATGCPMSSRPRSGIPDSWLAAMPLFGPPSAIVMGGPASTGRSEGDWLRTILHEHFHQWQSALPEHYARVGRLDLAGGDTSGMWMLNFDFPYADPKAGADFAAASNALADAVAARGGRNFLPAFDRFLAARRAFASTVGERNWRYLEFQLWQEGVARWTEIELGRSYPDARVKAAAANLEAHSLRQLRTPDLKRLGREVAYPQGAGEAMLLQACGPAWRKAYPGVLALGPLLETARAHCRRR
jgi:hypothetical protein